MTTATTLVLGATGKTGRRVVERLSASGADRATRFAIRNAALRLDGARHVACGRCRASMRSTFPTSRTSSRQAPLTRSATSPTLAVSSGVSRLVLLSGRGAPEARALRRAGATVRGRVHHRPRQLVQSELQRELPAGAGPRRRGRICPSATSANRLSMPMISPMSRSRHSRKTGTPVRSTRSRGRGCGRSPKPFARSPARRVVTCVMST